MSRVVLLDESLNVTATVETGKGHVRALRRIDDRWWAFRTDLIAITEAIEIRDDGTAGLRFSADAIGALLFVTHGQQPLLLVQREQSFDAVPFDPVSGFAAQRPFLTSKVLLEVQPFQDGSLLLLSQLGETQYDVAFVDASGDIRSHSPVFFTHEPQSPYASLGMSTTGPLFFFSPATADSWAVGGIDLYAWRLHSFAPLDPSAGELVSQVAAPPQRRRAARH
jgi:hypothetical protein